MSINTLFGEMGRSGGRDTSDERLKIFSVLSSFAHMQQFLITTTTIIIYIP